MKKSGNISLSILACICLAVFCRPGAGASRIAPEETIKAAFVFRFAQFTTWPTPLEDQFRLCIFGDTKTAEALEGYSGRTIHGSTLSTLRPPSTTISEDQCHAAFIGTLDRELLRGVIDSRGNRSILLISDFPGAFEEDADIALTTEPNRVTFSINLTQAKGRSFSFSSQMLKLARKIK